MHDDVAFQLLAAMSRLLGMQVKGFKSCLGPTIYHLFLNKHIILFIQNRCEMGLGSLFLLLFGAKSAVFRSSPAIPWPRASLWPQAIATPWP